MSGKLKSWLLDDAVFYTLLIISVAIVAFLLGRNSLVVTQPQGAGVIISQPKSSETIEVEDSNAILVVASRSGTKYHLPSCPGAKQIKDSNKITFSSIEQAQAAGYTPAANCDGF